jgi:hypothetical protein
MGDAWDLPSSELYALERFEEILARIDVHRFLVPVTLGVRPSLVVGHVRITCAYQWLDNYGSGLDVTVTMTYDVPMGASEADVIRAYRDLMAFACLHELDEAIHLDGRRLYDPHDGVLSRDDDPLLRHGELG